MYYIIKEEFKTETSQEGYFSYGIKWSADEENVSVSDLSLDRNKVENLVQLCNELQLDPVHLMDVAEDFVID